MWCTKELNKLRKNTRRKLRVTGVAIHENVPVHWESYHKAWRQYRKAVRQAKINSWRSIRESIDKILELTRLRNILAKNRGAVEEPLWLPNGNLTRTPRKVLDVLLKSHFPGARTNTGPERSLNITKSGANM